MRFEQRKRLQRKYFLPAGRRSKKIGAESAVFGVRWCCALHANPRRRAPCFLLLLPLWAKMRQNANVCLISAARRFAKRLAMAALPLKPRPLFADIQNGAVCGVVG
jgi:hypothetical protein